MKRKVTLIILGILIILLGTFRFSFAYMKNKIQEGENTNISINTCAKIQLKDNGNSINLENTYPMDDSMGLETEPYEFTITSTCEISVGFNLYITSTIDSTIEDKYIKFAIKDENNAIIVTNVLSSTDNAQNDFNEEETKQLDIGVKGTHKNIYKVYSDRVTYSEIKKYYLYLWIDSSATMETVPMGSSFKAGVSLKTDNGTEKHPYIINTIEDLVNLSNSVNSGKSYENEYIVLTKDLDFKNPNSYEDAERTDYGDINGNKNGTEGLLKELTSGSGFVPIGNSMTNSFKGNFDGNNKTIDHLYINNTKFGFVIGLFGDIKDSTISNLIVRGEIVSNVRSVRSGVIGRASGTNKVNNVINYVNVSSEQNEWEVSGIVGANFDTLEITNVKNYGKLSGGRNTGGIIGYNKGTITLKNAENYGEITNSTAAMIGGIIGANYNVTNDNNYNGVLNIENVHNYGKITNNYNGDETNFIGGLVGFTSGPLDIKNGTNNGNVTMNNNSSNNVFEGGIVGESINTTIFDNVVNNGNITITHNGRHFVGGLIGCISSGFYATIHNSKNIGTTINSNFYPGNASQQILGGLIGYNQGKTIIDNSFNNTDINGGNSLGGIVGTNGDKGEIIIDHCYNNGNLTTAVTIGLGSLSGIGGILGESRFGTKSYIFNSYNDGNLLYTGTTSTNINIGGILGKFVASVNGITTNYILNSYNLGDIAKTNSNTVVNGIYDEYYNQNFLNKIVLNNVYNAGKLTGTPKYGIGPTINNDNEIKNSYYLNDTGVMGSDKEDIGIPKTESKLKELTNTLNSNIEELKQITIKDLQTTFSDYELTFSKWQLGSNGYPVLEYK